MSRKFICGVKPLQQFMEDGSFLMPEIPAVLRAAQAMNSPEYIDYDYLLSVSGMALRLAWQQGWAEYADIPNQGIFYGSDVVETALERVGIKYIKRSVADVGVNTALTEIKELLDKDIPAILRGGPHVVSAVLGYDEDELFGVSTFADRSKSLPENGYNRIEGLKDEMEEYILITDFIPKPMDRKLLLDTFKTAVFYSRTVRTDEHGDTALGVSSFDAIAELMVWDEGFEQLNSNGCFEGELSFPYDRPDGYYRTDGAATLAQRFWSGYCDFLCMLNGYGNFARFLEKYADIIPEHSVKIKEASEYYNRACGYSGELWKYVTPDDAGVKKFSTKEVRYTFAAHMLRAKIYTLRAVEILEEILHRVCADSN